mgnify:CR=1 FL=1
MRKIAIMTGTRAVMTLRLPLRARLSRTPPARSFRVLGASRASIAFASAFVGSPAFASGPSPTTMSATSGSRHPGSRQRNRVDHPGSCGRLLAARNHQRSGRLLAARNHRFPWQGLAA